MLFAAFLIAISDSVLIEVAILIGWFVQNLPQQEEFGIVKFNPELNFFLTMIIPLKYFKGDFIIADQEFIINLSFKIYWIICS